MIKLVMAYRMTDGSRRDELNRWLAESAAPAVRDRASASGIRRYVQALRRDSAEIDGFGEQRGWMSAPDAVVEAWFDDPNALEAYVASGEASGSDPILLPDTDLLDRGATRAFASQEEVIFDYLAPGAREESDNSLVKMVVEVARLPDFPAEEFAERWRVAHGDLVREQSRAMGFLRYVQSHVVASAGLDRMREAHGWLPVMDGLTEVWWESEDAMRTTFQSEETARASAILAEDERKFVDSAGLSAFLADENMVLAGEVAAAD